MVQVHLVKMDLGLGLWQIEEFAADFRKLDWVMRQFPLAVLLWFYGRA